MLIESLKSYNYNSFKSDLYASLTVAVIALPLAMAFSIVSGAGPERGLFSAIIAGFLVSALGGSRVQVAGPSGTFAVIIYGILQKSGYEGLMITSMFSSGLLILFALLRFGSCIRYVPAPLIAGFSTGIAILVFSAQLKDFFGLNMGAVPFNFVERCSAYIEYADSFHLPTTLLGLGSLGVIFLAKRYAPKVPWAMLAIAFAMGCSYWMGVSISTVQSKFGAIPSHLPAPLLPSFQMVEGHFLEFFIDALMLAILGGMESLFSATVGDRMTGFSHNSNRELFAQGVANFAGALFGAIPASGALSRTAANVKSGAQTPVSGMLHSLLLLGIIYYLAPFASQIPLPALAAILITVSWKIADPEHLIDQLRAPFRDQTIFFTSFLLTLFVNLAAAIAAGMILAYFFYLKVRWENRVIEKN